MMTLKIVMLMMQVVMIMMKVMQDISMCHVSLIFVFSICMLQHSTAIYKRNILISGLIWDSVCQPGVCVVTEKLGAGQEWHFSRFTASHSHLHNHLQPSPHHSQQSQETLTLVSKLSSISSVMDVQFFPFQEVANRFSIYQKWLWLC